MPAPLDRDELRLRAALRDRIDGPPAPPAPPTWQPAPARERDWLDDYMDATTQPAPATPPAPPEPPKTTTTDTPGEPRWDWRRILHWPYARLCCGAAAALIPLDRGQSAATGWGSALHDCRTQASVGAAWALAGAAFAVAAVLVNRRRTWWTWTLLTSAFIGTVAMASPFDIVTAVTGVTK